MQIFILRYVLGYQKLLADPLINKMCNVGLLVLKKHTTISI